MLKAFHNDPKIKAKYLQRVLAHYKADEIVSGIYWENGKGCAVGCTIEGSDHSKYETELGIPKEVAYLEDVIFEELTNGKAKEFPIKFLKAVKVGSDLSKVTAKLMIWQWEDEKYGLKNIQEVIEDKELFKVCKDVVSAYKKVASGKKVSDEVWDELYKRADNGYWARAWARAGAWVGGARAWARAGAWVGGARAYEDYINAMADKFIELIKEA